LVRLKKKSCSSVSYVSCPRLFLLIIFCDVSCVGLNCMDWNYKLWGLTSNVNYTKWLSCATQSL
jgi:hypothetical protein